MLTLAMHAPSADAACPNESIREGQTSEILPLGTTTFPSCMALEMVTPPKKFGQETLSLTAFSADGGRALFVSKAALADTKGLMFFGGDSYVATRGAAGWTTSATSPPASADISGAGDQQGGPFSFAPDLDAWTLLGSTQAQKFAGKSQLFNSALGGTFAPLSPELVAIDNSGEEVLFGTFGSGQVPIGGSTPNLSATVFATAKSTVAFFSDDPRETKGSTNSYLAFHNSAGQPTLQLLARDQADKVWGGRCGAFLGGGGGGLNQGAISPDGSRIYFTTRPAQTFDPAHPAEAPSSPACNTANPLRILVHTGEGPQIEELLPGESSAPGNDLFQGASVDGSKVFLTSPRKLTASDQDPSSEACSSDIGSSKGCDLYLYDEDLPAGSRLIQVSVGGTGDPTPGEGADVLSSIAALSSDGSHAYFAAQGILTTDPNPEGKTATAGKPNLYLYERDAASPSGRTAFIGTLASTDKNASFETWGGTQSLASGRPYPVPLSGEGDGHVLFFLSKAQLTAEDEDGTHADVYRYDSTGAATLQCVSCAPGGDTAAADAIAGSSQGSTISNYAELGRWVSDDGQTAVFVTDAPLVESDEDQDLNAYMWREGQLYELPSMVSGEPRPFKLPTVSSSGGQVGFTTTDALLPAVDGDTAKDAYVVRVDGGFPNPVPPTPCDPLTEGACQGPASKAPALPAPATPSFSGPGNGTQVRCRKGQVKKRGSCVKQHKKKAQKKRASHKRGGSK